MSSSAYNCLPSVSEVDLFLERKHLPFGKAVRHQVRAALQDLRDQITKHIKQNQSLSTIFNSKESVLEHVAQVVAGYGSGGIQRVINATGVVVHTNLGRAPLARHLVESAVDLLSSYSTIEYDLSTGKRGKRGELVRHYLRQLSGAEDALVVNNNAAAVQLMLMALAAGKEVIISRGELVEIGGAFRIPDIMRTAGVKLVEVGTTNRTRLSDYEQAITEDTIALMKVHPSNYAIQGFVESVSSTELAQLAKQHQVLSFHDWGSGNFYRFQQPQLQNLVTVQQEVGTGMDLLTFSGDKLLGSTQAGIIVGRSDLVHALSKHPLYRAFRLDKVTLTLLELHIAAYFNMETLPDQLPTIGMLEQTAEVIRKKVETVYQGLKIPSDTLWACKVEEAASLTGGGALPEVYLDSCSLTLAHPKYTVEVVQTFFRKQNVPIVVRVKHEKVWLDFRTIFPEDFSLVIETVNELFTQSTL